MKVATQMLPPPGALEALWDLVENEMLPRYESDMSYRHGGFKRSTKVDPGDAEWFIAAIRSGLVQEVRACDLWLPASRRHASIFWRA